MAILTDPLTSTGLVHRGHAKNTNGLIRQYLPKGTDFTKVPDKQLKEIIEKLNNRPRENLAFRTPKEVLESFTGALQV